MRLTAPNKSPIARSEDLQQDLIDTVWSRAFQRSASHGTLYAQDAFGTWIYKGSYGRQDELGWEIDVGLSAQANGAPEPIHWKNKQLKDEGLLDPQEFGSR